jgi:DNA polymerase III epsilon subunit family exonuclease
MELHALLVLVVIALFIIAILVVVRRRQDSALTVETETTLREVLPERFVVFDLETTRLDGKRHEIIEIGAIRVHRDSSVHDTLTVLIKPRRRIPKNIMRLTGITQTMVDADGETLASALQAFRDFIGDLPLVCFNAEFDMAFLAAAGHEHGIAFENDVSCALVMSRRVWPRRRSYRLSDLARDGKLSGRNTHRALADCERTMIVYAAAAAEVRRRY